MRYEFGCVGSWLYSPTSSAARPGSGRNSSALTKVNIALLTPMPSASTATTTAAKPGARRHVRSAYRTSCASASTNGSPRCARYASAIWATPPKSRSAAARASDGVSPRRSWSAASSSRCVWISSSRSASRRRVRNTARRRDSSTPIARQLVFIAPEPHRSCFLQETVDDRHDPRPFLRFGGQVLAARSGDLVEPGAAIVVARAPRALDEALLLEAEQRWIDGALIEREHAARRLLDPPRDAVAVLRTHDLQRLQHHEVERPGREFGRERHVDGLQERRISPVGCQHENATAGPARAADRGGNRIRR